MYDKEFLMNISKKLFFIKKLSKILSSITKNLQKIQSNIVYFLSITRLLA